MVDPNNRQLRPPIHRSWLRLRLGKLYYGGLSIALPAGGLSDQAPIAEGLSGIQDNPIQPGHCKPEISHLVFLEFLILPPQMAVQGCGV